MDNNNISTSMDKMIKIKVINYLLKHKYQELCRFIKLFPQTKVDSFMSIHGLSIFGNALNSLEALDILIKTVSFSILQKLLSDQNYNLMKIFLICEKARLNGESKENQQKRIKIYQILLIIDRDGLENFIKNKSEENFLPKELFEDFMCAVNLNN